MKNKVLDVLTMVAGWVGTVEHANAYTEDFIIVEGTTADGRAFHVSLNIQNTKEEKKDGN